MKRSIRMKQPWFKQIGFLYIPVNFAGWVIFMAALGYSVFSFLAIDSRSHSASDTLRNFAFRLIIIGLVYLLLAYLTSHKRNKNK